MTINTPEDSVCDYLAELLYEDNSAADVAQPPSPQPTPAAEPAPSGASLFNGRTVPAPALANTASKDAVRLAEPAVDKERLTKLLNTARPQMAPEQPKPALAPKADVAPPAAPVKRPAPVSAEVPAPALASKTEAFVAVAWHDNGRPHWAQDRFDVLLFKVYGLTLAVPLIALGQIQPITEDLTPIFGQAKWFMGLQPTPMGQIKTVNTALFVMPERYNPEFLKTAKYVVSIDGLDWGLAVDSVQQPKSLDPEDVKWRTGRGQRPWLAGTIKAHMCALIDVQNMGRMLAASDRNRNH